MEKENMYMHTMEYYSALKRKDTLSFAATWMNFEDAMLMKHASNTRTNAAQLHL
jgi:hypothetical protein